MKTLMATVALSALATGAVAQGADVPDNLEKLSNFQSTGVTEFTFVEQGGDYAEGIKRILAEEITLPEGFCLTSAPTGQI